ncbi:MAG TPA: hypothetical protein VHN15_07000 [Thermoanaerobaculia bacterium]|nr:hypothetical protein [Thermoanaerobaculia bacterium]
MRSAFLCGIGFLLLGAAAPSPEKDLTAAQILKSMAQAYADCQSYSDSGVVKTVFFKGQYTWTDEKPFTTAFVRPDRFRFEYQEVKKADLPKERYIVWRDGDVVRSWSDFERGVRKQPSLGMAVAGATGVSGASAHTVSTLILPEEIGGRRLTDITEARRIEDAREGSTDCFRIQGRYADSPVTVWVDKQTFLVRRIDLSRADKDLRTERTTTYEPVINGEVTQEMLAFDPPADSAAAEK